MRPSQTRRNDHASGTRKDPPVFASLPAAADLVVPADAAPAPADGWPEPASAAPPDGVVLALVDEPRSVDDVDDVAGTVDDVDELAPEVVDAVVEEVVEDPATVVVVVAAAVVVVVVAWAAAAKVQVICAGLSPALAAKTFCRFQYLSIWVAETGPRVQAIPTLYVPGGMSPGL